MEGLLETRFFFKDPGEGGVLDGDLKFFFGVVTEGISSVFPALVDATAPLNARGGWVNAEVSSEVGSSVAQGRSPVVPPPGIKMKSVKTGDG